MSAANRIIARPIGLSRSGTAGSAPACCCPAAAAVARAKCAGRERAPARCRSRRTSDRRLVATGTPAASSVVDHSARSTPGSDEIMRITSALRFVSFARSVGRRGTPLGAGSAIAAGLRCRAVAATCVAASTSRGGSGSGAADRRAPARPPGRASRPHGSSRCTLLARAARRRSSLSDARQQRTRPRPQRGAVDQFDSGSIAARACGVGFDPCPA